MAHTTLYLVRHGEQSPEANHSPDGGLSAKGRDQAGRLGRRLSTVTFDAVHHSPLARAAETARIVATHLPAGTPVHECDHARDRTPIPSDKSGYPERWHGWLDTVPEDERDEDAVALTKAFAYFRGAGEHQLVVTHAFVIGWFVRQVLDAPPWRWIGLNHDNCGLTIVQFDPERPATLLTYNDTGHL